MLTQGSTVMCAFSNLELWSSLTQGPGQKAVSLLPPISAENRAETAENKFTGWSGKLEKQRYGSTKRP